MTTKAKAITKGGAKGHEWERYFTPGDGHPLAPKAVKAPRSAEKGPLGASTTIIPNPANPPARIIADDTAVRVGGTPLANPTVGSGSATAPAAAAVIADSGPMPAGTYRLEVRVGGSVVRTAGKHLQVEHRDAANAANINILALSPGEPLAIETDRIVLALNQRIRVIVGAILFGAGEVAQGLVRLYLLPI